MESNISLSRITRKTATRSTLMLLYASDLTVVCFSAILAIIVRFRLMDNAELATSSLSLPALIEHYLIYIILTALTLPALLLYRGSYSLQQLARYRYGSFNVLSTAFYWALVFISFTLFFETQPAVSRIWVGLTGLFAGLGLASSRYFICRHFIGGNLLQSIRRKTLVVGWNERADQFYNRSELSSLGGDFFPFRIRSCVILSDEEKNTDYPSSIYRGDDFKDIEKQLKNGRHDTLVLANSNLSNDDIMKLQELCGREMIDFMIFPDFVHTLISCLEVESFGGLPMLTQNKQKMEQGLSILTKRLFDIAGSLIGLILSAPIISFFCWRVYRESPGPVFYRQVRAGEHGKPFEIIKIRSMRLNAEEECGAKWCTKDDTRRLSIGTFMRKYNIDELPQFWNVLKGEMSLVGPRPERPELINDFKYQVSFYNVRHMVKPGITGWAQVNGWRGDTCLESRIASDLEYIERWSIWFDIYICLKTLVTTKNAY